MALWHSLALWIFHALYTLSEIIKLVARFLSVELKQCDTDELLPRGKLPAHLAVAFTSAKFDQSRSTSDGVDEDEETMVEVMLESARRVLGWCAQVGIATVTFYDKKGLLKARLQALDASSEATVTASSTPRSNSVAPSFTSLKPPEQPVEPSRAYLTPPPSDDSTSNSTIDGTDSTDDVYSFTVDVQEGILASFATNPHHQANLSEETIRRRVPDLSTTPTTRVQVNVASAINGRPSIARVAQDIAHTRARATSAAVQPISLAQLDETLHAELAPPQLLILHSLDVPPLFNHPPPLRGTDLFPPWQLRLTELHWTEYHRPSLFKKFSAALSFATTGEKDPAVGNVGFLSLDKRMLVRALNEFATSEERIGK